VVQADWPKRGLKPVDSVISMDGQHESHAAIRKCGVTMYTDHAVPRRKEFPASTFGRARKSPLARDTTPAPGSYNVHNYRFDSRHKQSMAVSLDGTGREHVSAEEHLSFRRADKNSDGKLDFDEIKSVLQVRFPDVRNREIHDILQAADNDGDGKLGFQEFYQFMHSQDPKTFRIREMFIMSFAIPGRSQSYRECDERLQFRRADLNLDGQLDYMEIETLMRNCFPDIKKRDVRDLLNGADRTHDGKLDFQEIIDYTHSTDPSSRRLREKLIQAFAALTPMETSIGSRSSSSCCSRSSSSCGSRPISSCGTASGRSSRSSSKQGPSKMRRIRSASSVGSMIVSH